jgi:hypothetical protein
MMTHRYIDEHSVAERYLERALPPPEHDAFESHLVECDECTDRLLLAQIFLDHRAIGTARASSATAQEPAVPTLAAESTTAESESTKTKTGPAASAMAELDPQAAASGVPVSAAAERPHSERPEPEWPKRAQFVAQFTPWQLFFLAVGAAAWLLLVPTAYFLGQLMRLSGTH